MTQTNTVKKKIAVIGLGNIGTAVATNFVKGNRQVIVADRKIAKANSLASELGPLVTPLDIPSAIREADMIVFAVWFNVMGELFEQYAADLNGKIVIDPSNPIAPDENGGFKKIIAANESAGEINALKLPAGAKLAKAFGTLGVASLKSAAFQTPDQAVLFYASDDSDINTAIEELIRDNGFEPYFIGGLDQSLRIEVFGDLHEFGALGKTITLAEINDKEIQPVN